MKLQHHTWHITGGRPLRGEVRIHSAKNSALYLILAALLTPEPVVLKDIPKLSDIVVMLDMLRYFGAEVYWQGHDVHINAQHIHTCHAPYHLVSKMRASFVALGALLARCGHARVSMPGGCAFGPRPVDRHIKAFRQLGVDLLEEAGDFTATRIKPLQGRVVFEAPTVGGTQNIILASALGSETVIIDNAALEPEVLDLAQMLSSMGADIQGAGTSCIRIQGVAALRGCTYRPLPDRIEAGTFMLAAAATRGHITLHRVCPVHLQAVSDKLRESGVKVLELDNSIVVDARAPLQPVNVTALEYPGIPTDLQAPFGAFLATVAGTSIVTDEVYPDRFTHVEALLRSGAVLEMRDRALVIQGGALHGADMHAADIRAGGALVVAALAAEGASSISGVEYIARGYEALPERLLRLGARVQRGPVITDETLATGTFGD